MARKWFAVFDFQDAGYVKDDEKLNAGELMSTMKEMQQQANEQRQKRGLAQMYTDGWIVEPHYDAQTKQLEWGVRLHSSSSDEPVVNYTMRLLGRHGYESVTLVTSPEALQTDIQALRMVLKEFDFNSGEKYSEFRSGDHVAEFGLVCSCWAGPLPRPSKPAGGKRSSRRSPPAGSWSSARWWLCLRSSERRSGACSAASRRHDARRRGTPATGVDRLLREGLSPALARERGRPRIPQRAWLARFLRIPKLYALRTSTRTPGRASSRPIGPPIE